MIRYLQMAADDYTNAGNSEKAFAIWEQLRRDIADKPDELKVELLDGLRGLARQEKDRLLEISIMEELIELNPANTSLRFDLAFTHSEEGNSDMALYHYLKIPTPERHSAAWNNLGVSFSDFQMHAKAIRAYRASEEQGGVLAMCNMGQKFLGAGFFDEAKEMADKARSADADETQISSLQRRLNASPDEEGQKLQTALNDTRPKAEFFRKLGASVLRPTPKSFPVIWSSPEIKLETKLEGRDIRFTGTYQVKPLGGLVQNPFAAVVSTYKFEFVGKVQGGAIFGKTKRSTTDGTVAGLFSSSQGEPTVMIINEGCSEISVMERADSRNPSFYDLKVVN